MRIAREEIFGPVTAVIPFNNEAEAVKIANATDFGLIAGIYTHDFERAWRVSHMIDVGVALETTAPVTFMVLPLEGENTVATGASMPKKPFVYSVEPRPSISRPDWTPFPAGLPWTKFSARERMNTTSELVVSWGPLKGGLHPATWVFA
jgi:hypothetical protein